MRYTQARELVETILDTLNEGTRKTPSKKVVGERPEDTNWDEVNRNSRSHARAELFREPANKSVTDSHLPGGAAAALARSRAAFARTPKSKGKK